jgi:hypothetical protein
MLTEACPDVSKPTSQGLYFESYAGESDFGLRMNGDDTPWMLGETGYSDSETITRRRAAGWVARSHELVSDVM